MRLARDEEDPPTYEEVLAEDRRRDAPRYARLSAVQRRKIKKVLDERYSVRKPMMNEIIMRLQAGEPTVDLLADRELHMCPRWYGKGGEQLDAFAEDWGKEELCWCNPPFSAMQEVVDKLIRDRARSILIMPHWRSQDWFQDVQPYVKKTYFYKKKTLLFEKKEGMVGGLPWPV